MVSCRVEELDGRELEERVAGWEGSWEVPDVVYKIPYRRARAWPSGCL